MKWALRLYPALFALLPAFVALAKNPGLFPASQVVGAMAATLAGVLLVALVAYAALRLVRPHDVAADLAALVAGVAVALYYLYDRIPVGPAKVLTRAHPILAVLAIFAIGYGARVVARRGLRHRLPPLQSIARVATIFPAALLVWSAGAAAISASRSKIAIMRSPLVQELEQPVPVRAASMLPGSASRLAVTQLPDIFVILLDEYASDSVLREQFGFDNHAFEDSLRALGFRIPASLRSNYSITILSVTSLLNFAHLRPLADATGAGLTDYAPAGYLLEHNRAERFLRSRGYRFVFLPSLDYGPTRSNDDADVTYDPYPSFSLGRTIQRSEFIQHILRRTLFSHFVLPHLADQPTVAAEHAARTLEGVPTFAGARQPTFVFAHVMMPHIPFVEDGACRPATMRASDSVRMAAELMCLNRQTLAAVHEILQRSQRPPIIILQGDHGSQELNPFRNRGAVPTVAQARERFRPFGAYYLPNGGASAFPDSVTLVNVMRYIFDYYFNANLAPLPNTMYYSHWRRPYMMTEIAPDFHPILAAAGGTGTSR